MNIFGEKLAIKEVGILLTLLLLVIVTPLIIYLVKNQLVFKSKALEGTKLEIVNETGEPITTTSIRNVKLKLTYPPETRFPIRVAESVGGLSLASEQIFDTNPAVFDFVLTQGSGIKTVYAQFKLDGVWGPVVAASITLISDGVEVVPISPSPSPSPSPPQLPSRFDLNKDGKVNSVDVSSFLAQWRQSKGQGTIFDFNRDHLLNSIDYAILRKNLKL